MHEYGLPQYPPDEHDTRFTYPLHLCLERRHCDFVNEVVTVQSEPEERETMSSAESLEASSSESDDVNSVNAIPDDELRHTRSAVASHLVPTEDAARACGIIERSWIHYAVEMLHDSELIGYERVQLFAGIKKL